MRMSCIKERALKLNVIRRSPIQQNRNCGSTHLRQMAIVINVADGNLGPSLLKPDRS